MESMTKRVLLIGIIYANTKFELKGCHQDVQDMARALKSRGFTEFHFLIDYGDEQLTWIDEFDEDPNPIIEKPTRAKIIATISELCTKSSPADYLYIHFSGHGTVRPGGYEFDKQDECICPMDFLTAGVITDNKLFRILVKKFKGKSLRASFDSCHSGSVLDLPYMYVRPELTPFGTCQILESLPMLNPPNVALISGCSDDGKSGDIVLFGKANGWMTRAMVSCINENKTKSLTSLELMTDINKQLAVSNQTAQLSYCQPMGWVAYWFD